MNWLTGWARTLDVGASFRRSVPPKVSDHEALCADFTVVADDLREAVRLVADSRVDIGCWSHHFGDGRERPPNE